MALIRCLMLLTVVCILVCTFPVSARKPKIRPEYRNCEQNFRHIINIGNDVYLSIQDDSELFYYFNIEKGIPFSNFNLWSTGSVSWRNFFGRELHSMRAIVPLTDFCLHSPLCDDSSWKAWNEFENVVLIYGAIDYWTISRSSPEGFFLARRTINPGGIFKQKFTLLGNSTVGKNVLEKMRFLNFTLLERDEDVNRPDLALSIAPKSYFNNHQAKADFRFIGAVFVPSRAEMLILATYLPYDVIPGSDLEMYTLAASKDMYLLRRKFDTFGGQWSEIPLTQTGLDPDLQLIGLIRIGENVHLVGENTEFFDVLWDEHDEISIKRSNKAPIVDCDFESSETIKTGC